MRSIPWTLTWEMLTFRRWHLLASLLVTISFPVILFAALRREGPVPAHDPNMIISHVILIQFNMFVFGMYLIASQGRPSRLYVFPISTSSIVAWHLIPAMAVMVVESIALTMLLNALFQLEWPLWGPALFAAVGLAAIQAVLWLTEKTLWMVVGLGIVGTILGIWFKARFGGAFSTPAHFWEEVTPAEVATMLGIAGLAYLIGNYAVARNRRGDTLPSLGIIDWLGRALDAREAFRGTLRGPVQAHFWSEWRLKGWVMPAAVLFGMIVCGVLWLVFSRDVEALVGGFLAGGAFLSAGALIGGLLIGNVGPLDGTYDMSPFLATRPMSTGDMARTTLRVAAVSVFAMWLIWFVGFAVLFLILLASDRFPREGMPEGWWWWYFPASFLAPWIVASVGTSISLAGRSASFVKLLCAGFAIYIISTVSAGMLTREAQLLLARIVTFALGMIFCLATLMAFVWARRRWLIGWPTVYFAASLWVGLSALVVFARNWHPEVPLHLLMFLVGIAAVAVVSFAAAPLALAWNRTR